MKKIFLLLVLAGMASAFSVEAVTQPPTPTLPCNNQGVTSFIPELRWNAIAGSRIIYRWEVRKVINDSRIDWSSDLVNLSETRATIAPNNLENNTDYKWRVSAQDQAALTPWSEWSSYCMFKTTWPQAPPPPSGDNPVIYDINPENGPLGTPIKITGVNLACSPLDLFKKKSIAFTGDNNQIIPPDEPPKCDGEYSLKTAIPAGFPKNIKTVAVQVQVDNKISAKKDFSVVVPAGGTNGGINGPQYGLNVAWPPTPLGTAMPTSTLPVLIQYLYEWGISLAGFAAFIVLVIAGFQYLTSVGNSSKMQGAIDRIKSAGLGIILLFGSILVLNTINPRLTQLKIPPIGDNAKIGEIEIKNTFDPCEGATVFYKGGDITFAASDSGKRPELFPNPSLVDRVKITGLCQVKLCRENDCSEEADPPVISIFSDTNIADMGKNIESMPFTSAELIDLCKTLNIKCLAKPLD